MYPNDQILKSRYIGCLGECCHPEGLAAACHLSCHVYTGTPSRQLRVATCPDFDPRPTESIATDAIISTLLEEIHSKYAIPIELCRIIKEDLAKPWCAAYGALSSLQASTPSQLVVGASSPVWVTFRRFYGRVYLSSLSNLHSGGTCECLLYDPRSPAGKKPDVVYVACDAWGIVKIIYAESSVESDLVAHKGVWWRTLPLTNKTNMLVESDVLHLMANATEACSLVTGVETSKYKASRDIELRRCLRRNVGHSVVP